MSNTRLYLVTSVVCLAQLAAGMFLGWMSPILSKLLTDDFSFDITTDEASWIVSLLKLGMAFGCLSSILIVDLVGRKLSILFAVVPMFLSWLLTVWNSSILNLYMARFVGGIASGIVFTSGSLFVTEVSPPHIRGVLCSCFVLMDYCGNLLGYVVGSFGNLQQYSYVAMSLALLQFLLFVWFPDTPYYLLRRKRFGDAMDSLMFLRGSADVSVEMDSIMKSVECDVRHNGIFSSILYFISQSGGKRLILIGIGVMTVQAFSDSIILITYTQTMFKTIYSIQLQEGYMDITIAAVYLISYLVCISMVDHLGRRPLLIISTAGVISCSFLLGAYFCMQRDTTDITNLEMLPFAAILFYVMCVSLGLTSVPYIIVNEIFPMYARATCVGICYSINFTWSFVILRIWSVIVLDHNVYSIFWFIFGLNALGIFFLAFYLPETRNKSFLQIGKNFVEGTKK